MSELNFKHIGRNVTISPKASIYRPEMIEIGDNVRIDDFCILSAGDGGISIGDNVHIAPYCSLVGKGRIVLEKRSQFAQRVYLMSSSDDFSGSYLVGPCVPEAFRNVKHGDITIGRDSVIGCNAVIFPGVTVGANSAIGAMSLVNRDVPEDVIYAGIPAKYIKDRFKRNYEVDDAITHFAYQPGE
jgi:galactoside O-acetyltransferase